MSSLLPPKKDVALALLERASVFIHLDPRGEKVLVPPWLKKQPQLVLQIGLNMAVKIPDLELADEAVRCTLSFSRRPHYCSVPWNAVYALVGEDGRGMVWPEDIPPEVSSQAQVTSKAAERPTLRPVQGGLAPVRPDVEPSNSIVPRAPTIPPESFGENSIPDAARRTASDSIRPDATIDPEIKENNSNPPRSPSERPYLRLVK
jgi:stringent starvation protein B